MERIKMKVVIDEVQRPIKKQTVPTILNFPGTTLKEVDKKNVEYCRITHGEDHGALVVANEQIFHGVTDAADRTKLTDTYICVHDTTTNKVRIIPVEQVQLRNHLYHSLEEKQVNPIEDARLKAATLKKFSGRNALKVAFDQEKMKVNVDNVKDNIDASLNDCKFNDSAEENDGKRAPSTMTEFLRPPYNPDAISVDQVFTIEDVLTKALLTHLKGHAKAVYHAKLDELDLKSQYLQNLLKNLQSFPLGNKTLKHITCIIYMDALLTLMKKQGPIRKMEFSYIAIKCVKHIFANLSDPDMPGLATICTKEKAICQFLLLVLLLNEKYETGLDEMIRILGVSRKKLLSLARIVFVVPKHTGKTLVLRLPKDVPDLPTNFRRNHK